MYINWARRELGLKVVYYGPALSGKTTNLARIHGRIIPQARSDLICLKTSGDRTIFFDFLELRPGKIVGMTPRIHLYTVPGQPQYETSRKMVLRGADGIVFVGDAQVDRMEANLQAWAQMQSQLGDQGVAWKGFPLVIQLNKRDLPGSMGAEHLLRGLGLDGPYTVIEASAIQGIGVLDTLRTVVERMIVNVRREADLAREPASRSVERRSSPEDRERERQR